MLRYLRIIYCFKFLIGFGLLSCMSTISFKITTSATSTQLYGFLLNDCTFLRIHKVKYCMVTSDFVWLQHLTILQYILQKKKKKKRKQHICTAVGIFDALKGLGYLQKRQLDLIKFHFHQSEE